MSIYGSPVTLGPRWMTAQKVSILPYQAGAGDPSPSNLRPIYGYDACDVWVSPTPNPADGTTYQTIFGSPPGTVYGGEFDLTTGVLTVDRAIISYPDSTGFESHSSGRWYHTGLPSGADYSKRTSAISNQATYSDSTNTYRPYFAFGSAGVYINKLSADETIEQFSARLTANPFQICYYLATPITYQLTPQSIKFLSNYYIGANCGPVLIKVGK